MRVSAAARKLGRAVSGASGAVVTRFVVHGRGFVSHALEMAGGSAIAYGAWTVSRPAGFIVAGVLAIGYAYLIDGSRK